MLKTLLRRGLARLGYRVSRSGSPSRFQAMAETLDGLRRRDYRPRRIIDAGANRGEWTRLAYARFPAAAFTLIEPQAACRPALVELARTLPNAVLHPVALSAPGVARVGLAGGGGGGGTGAWVVRAGESALVEEECPACTLDELVPSSSPEERLLLKLDLEGHESAALAGATRLLSSVEVLLTEVRFYDDERGECPAYGQLAAWLHERGFEVYDFASLSARPRDGRLRAGDVVFVRRSSPLRMDSAWV